MDQPVPHPHTGFLPSNLPISANAIDERTFEAHETREGHSGRDGEARCVSDRWTQPCEDSPHQLFTQPALRLTPQPHENNSEHGIIFTRKPGKSNNLASEI